MSMRHIKVTAQLDKIRHVTRTPLRRQNLRCSHYLFLYSDHVNLEQHFFSMKELCCVTDEARVYPLVTLNGSRSKHIDLFRQTRVCMSTDVFFLRCIFFLKSAKTRIFFMKDAVSLLWSSGFPRIDECHAAIFFLSPITCGACSK